MPLVSYPEFINAAIAGKVVSFPTDTVPALAVIPPQSERIFTLKQRTADKPLILMVAELDAIWEYVVGTPEEQAIWTAIAKKYWPGQLTLVLPASEKVPVAMNPLNYGTVGIRIPNSSIALDILRQTGPLATTSANLSGQPPLETMNAIVATFPDVIALNSEYLSPTPTFSSGQPSTVIQWTDNSWKTLRQGAIVL
ncbi:MAG: L-threonylcarbamoyladenylate synthase [Snowella sp.]|nr:L-threonylcarbamoyladenylate synthase [Snowella sp.]